MKVKTNDLIGQPLDWAVTSIETPEALKYGVQDWREQRSAVKNSEFRYRWHQSWAQGGPLIEREWISVWQVGKNYWKADRSGLHSMDGPTPLIAACRCYVASKLGDEIEIPEELK